MLKWKNTLLPLFFCLTSGAKVTETATWWQLAAWILKEFYKTKTLVSVLTSCANKPTDPVHTKFISWGWGVHRQVQILHRAEALPSSNVLPFCHSPFSPTLPSPPVGFSFFCRLQFVPLLPGDRAWGEQCLLLFCFHNGWQNFLQKIEPSFFSRKMAASVACWK